MYFPRQIFPVPLAELPSNPRISPLSQFSSRRQTRGLLAFIYSSQLLLPLFPVFPAVEDLSLPFHCSSFSLYLFHLLKLDPRSLCLGFVLLNSSSPSRNIRALHRSSSHLPSFLPPLSYSCFIFPLKRYVVSPQQVPTSCL